MLMYCLKCRKNTEFKNPWTAKIRKISGFIRMCSMQ